MTGTEIIRELKCKFTSCPCQKCTKERNDNGKDGVNHELYQRDTPPERPQPKYQFQCKCLCKPETLHRRKCPPALPQPRQPIAKTSRGCSEMDDCNTGKGCCNTERNFISFMMNIIGLIAWVAINYIVVKLLLWYLPLIFCRFLLLATIVFWLFLLKCTVLLGVRVYHSNRYASVESTSMWLSPEMYHTFSLLTLELLKWQLWVGLVYYFYWYFALLQLHISSDIWLDDQLANFQIPLNANHRRHLQQHLTSNQSPHQLHLGFPSNGVNLKRLYRNRLKHVIHGHWQKKHLLVRPKRVHLGFLLSNGVTHQRKLSSRRIESLGYLPV